MREKRAAVDMTTQQIEYTLPALDPAARAVVIARLPKAAGATIDDHVHH